MKCPVCRATYRSPSTRDQEQGEDSTFQSPDLLPKLLNCHRCGVDLSPLIQIHDQALWYYCQAIQALQAGNYPAAITWNNQALALCSNNADFHALAGQLWALQGEFRQAILAWETARQISPQHQAANAYLAELERLVGV
jgi:tetratricopeptide (TPR) repeat protein